MIVSGPTEAVLIDGGFTFPHGDEIARAIRASGKTLTTIYISQSDPDYYFGLKPLVAAFPEARVLAAPKGSAALKAAMQDRFPDLGMGIALDIGAKVATGELTWGRAGRDP